MKPYTPSLLLLAVILPACSLAPTYVRPDVGYGNAWDVGHVTTDAQVDAQWWQRFGSPELNQLVTQALAQNNDLVASAERVAQARASLRVAGASLWPSVSAGASTGYSRPDLNAGGSSSTSANAAASYELDLFGANASTRKAAKAQLEAAGFDRDALALTTASDVAQTYVNVVMTRERVRLAHESLEASRKILALLETRLRVGTAALLDVSQQRSAVAQAEANVSSLIEQEVTYRHALAILVGVAPQDFKVDGTTLSSLSLPDMPVSAPAALLERRPDLKVAEANLKAANANIGAARAAFFPTTTLSAGLTQGFDPAVTGVNVGASLLAPIFNGGANIGNLQAANARQRELVATYRQAVLTAFGEAGNALATLHSADVRMQSQRVAATEADTALRLARLQLDAGSSDMPTLLTTQTSSLNTKDAEVQARASALTARVNVVRVMGGPILD